MKFKVDGRVVIRKDRASWASVFAGDLGTVVEIEDDSYKVVTDIGRGEDNRNYWWLREEDLDHAPTNNSCGDDTKTLTKYAQEKNAGDRLKVILLQVYDLCFIDNLQVSEIKALLGNLVDEHIEETDEADDE